jgi:hypothetical protein
MNTTDKKHTDTMQAEELDQEALDQIRGGLVGEKHNGFTLRTGGMPDIKNGNGYTIDYDTWN